MIRVTVKKADGRISEVECSGHSGYAEVGNDIVCSAVSAVVQTALLGIIDASTEKTSYHRRHGYLKFSVPTAKNQTESIQQDAILNTMLLGVKDIEKGFRAFVKLEEY